MQFSRLSQSRFPWFAATILFFATAAAAQNSTVPARVTEAVDPENLVTLHGNTHPLARAQFDRGAAPDSLPMRRMLLLLQRSPEQEKDLENLLVEQQVKSSPNYHHWLTPQEFGTKYGPTDSDIQAVTGWLSSQGFEVSRVAAGRTIIEFTGTAGQVRQALHTEIHKFEVNGQEHWANASDPQIPSALGPVIKGVVSLNNFPRRTMLHRLGTFSKSKATGEVRPLFTYPPGTTTNLAVGPGDFATIYNVQPLLTAGKTGTGVTIGIVATSNINIQDVRDFRSMFGLPAKDPQVILDGPDPGILASGSEGESDLDVQWAGAVAQNANIVLVASQDTETSFGDDLSSLYIVDNNLADVMSDSFGTCESALGAAANAFYNALWQQAAAQGITVFVAAGDSGSAECDDPNTENAAQFGLGIDGISSTPYNIAVGGTDFTYTGTSSTNFWGSNAPSTQTSAKSYIPESTWNDSCARTGSLTGCGTVSSNGNDLVGGGGGPSSCTKFDTSGNCVPGSGYVKPAWQTGSGVPADGVRDTPDVSLFAADGLNGSFYVFCQADANAFQGGSSSSCDLSSPFLNFQGAGGTSFASPAFAGIMAIINQSTGSRQGNANYVFYPLAATSGASCASSAAMAAGASASACIFYDTVRGNNSVACQAGTPNCGATTSSFSVLVNPSSPTQLAWTTNAGYDLATGLGTVNVANLVNKWGTVSFNSTTTTLASITPTTITHGQSVTITGSVTSGAGTPTGSVSLIGSSASQPSGIGSFPLTSGSFNGTTTFLPGGTYNVRAHYAGDGQFGASDSTFPGIQVTVNKEPSQTHLSVVTFDWNTGQVTSNNSNALPYGSPYILRIDVTNASGLSCAPAGMSLSYPCPTGSISLTDNGAPLNDFSTSNASTLNSQGYAEDALISLGAGSHILGASYSLGDNSYSPSSGTDVVSIIPAGTSTTLTSSAIGVQAGTNVTLTVTVSAFSNGAPPSTGTVQFFNGGTLISGTPVYTQIPYDPTTNTGAGLKATLVTSFSTVGTVTLTAQFGPDTNYAQSNSSAVTVNVTAAPPNFTFTANPTTISISSPGQSGSTTLTVTPTNGFTGTVNFTCTVPANMAESTCTMAPTSLTTSGTTTLTVNTTAPHSVGSVFKPQSWLTPGAGLLLLCLVLMSLSARRRRLKLAFSVMFLAFLATSLGACGGGGGGGGGPTTDPGTAAGTYSVVVTATSGSLSNSASVTVTVL